MSGQSTPSPYTVAASPSQSAQRPRWRHLLPLPLAMIVLAGCGGSEADVASPDTSQSASASVSPRPTATPKKTPTPKTTTPTPAEAEPTQTTGDYGADLAAIGIIPDSVAGYGEFMARNMCSDDDPTDVNSLFNMNVRVALLPGSVPESGGGVETLRLAVDYFCPERAGVLEESIETHGFTTPAP